MIKMPCSSPACAERKLSVLCAVHATSAQQHSEARSLPIPCIQQNRRAVLSLVASGALISLVPGTVPYRNTSLATQPHRRGCGQENVIPLLLECSSPRIQIGVQMFVQIQVSPRETSQLLVFRGQCGRTPGLRRAQPKASDDASAGPGEAARRQGHPVRASGSRFDVLDLVSTSHHSSMPCLCIHTKEMKGTGVERKELQTLLVPNWPGRKLRSTMSDSSSGGACAHRVLLNEFSAGCCLEAHNNSPPPMKLTSINGCLL